MCVTVTTSSVDETKRLGRVVCEVLRPGMVIGLIGGLGAGKTALAQGVASGLGVTDVVTSPTFTMVATYRTDGQRGISSLHHADLYRVSSGVEADDLAISELVEDDAVAVVEWSDVAPDVLGIDRLIVTIELGAHDDERVVTFGTRETSVAHHELAGVLGSWPEEGSRA